MLAAALEYAGYGWPAFRQAPGTKKPLKGSHGFCDATTDVDTITRWWTDDPECNVAVSCGYGLAVLDVDTKDDKRGDRTLAELVRDRGPIGWTRSARTPSGGVHFYFAVPRSFSLRRGTEALGEGLDILGAGSVTLPPSRLSHGSYTWVEDGAPGFAAPSPWLLEAMRAPELAPPPARPSREHWGADVGDRAKRAIAYADRMDVAIAGASGHATAYKVALVLVRGFNLPLAIAREILIDYSSRCSPPWSAREIDHKLADATNARTVPGYLLEART